MLPTELETLTAHTGRFTFATNNFCGDLPTEVAALSTSRSAAAPSSYPSASSSYWDLSSGNDLGTPCCETLPSQYTCEPTPMPTPL